MTESEYNIVKCCCGEMVFDEFDFPEDITGLDIDILSNTMDYYIFLANMSDDWSVTQKETSIVMEYTNKHNIPIR